MPNNSSWKRNNGTPKNPKSHDTGMLIVGLCSHHKSETQLGFLVLCSELWAGHNTTTPCFSKFLHLRQNFVIRTVYPTMLVIFLFFSADASGQKRTMVFSAVRGKNPA
ncbi:hypothetical protein LZ31DRAFT_327957 [Colletotrichum somersetense]|nr:hypothetical protein LZ31DRAFT_327957 [Colletotrichum somersetense]